MDDERRAWSATELSVPPSLLVVDHDAFVVPDLATGRVYVIELDELDALLDDCTATPTCSDEARVERAQDLDPIGDAVSLVTPVVLRLDGGAVLCWDSLRQGLAEVTRAELAAIAALHARRSVAALPASEAVGDPVAVAGLLDLGLVTLDSPGSTGHLSNGPNAAAAAAQEVMVELRQRAALDEVPDEDESPPPAPGALHGSSEAAPEQRTKRHWSVYVEEIARRSRELARRTMPSARNGHRQQDAAEDLASPDPGLPEKAHSTTGAAEPALAGADVVIREADSSRSAHSGNSTWSDVTDDSVEKAAEQEDPAPESPVHEFRLENDGRMPVIPLYSWGTVSQDCGQLADEVEPVLSIGMLLAHVRSCRSGELNELYDFVKVQPDSTEVLAAWLQDPTPAIFLFSDYLWNLDQHLEWSRLVKEQSPQSLCIHGGPSCPKYAEDVVRFVTDNPGVDVAVRGEGELVFEELLVTLDGDIDPRRLDRLSEVAGVTFEAEVDGTTQVVRTRDAERPTDLDVFPSPYLTGEFDDLLRVPWRSAAIETNRGCPYGCTFCDWGSATLSRIRKFDLDRVRAELDWVMESAAPPDLLLTDANFGIFARDVDIAEHIVELRHRFNLPYTVTISGMAKNTVKYSVPIIQAFVGAGIGPIAAQSVQSTDEATLEAIQRHNIKLERFDDMAAAFRDLGLPLVTDILMGLPGSTVESFKNDLQDCFDREVTARTMEILLLPNSPMNDPEYREEWQIGADDFGVVCASSTFTRDDYAEMKRIRLLFRGLEHFGLLRHVLRHLQWAHGIRALDVMHDIDRSIVADPNRRPLLSFVGRVFDLYTVPPLAWDPFFAEVEDFLLEQYGIEADPGLRTVIDVQRATLPARGRSFPHTVELDHDYLSYRADLASVDDPAMVPRLEDYGTGTLTVEDPHRVCDRYIQRNELPERRDHTTSNLFWVGYDWELATPLMRHLVTNVTTDGSEL